MNLYECSFLNMLEMSLPNNEEDSWTFDEDWIETVMLKTDISHEESQEIYKVWAKSNKYETVSPHVAEPILV